DQGPDAALAYTWFVDGRRAGRQPTFRFVAPPAATAATHAVEVQVSGGARSSAPRVSWTVAVTPRMREADVREWLDRLASACARASPLKLRRPPVDIRGGVPWRPRLPMRRTGAFA